MTDLPARADFVHLRKQAKRLLREARAQGPEALRRFAVALPALRGRADLAPRLRLHDAQSVIAREHGFASWPELKRYVESARTEQAAREKTWLGWAYDGGPRARRLALRLLAEDPTLRSPSIRLACGDSAHVRAALAADPGWANRPEGPLGMPPLIAVTHSGLIRESGLEAGLLDSAGLLLAAGADPNARWIHPQWPDWPYSPLYGAAGRTHHPGMMRLLLAAGATPDDNESLYHAIESRDPAGMNLLLAAGARVAGTNAIGRALDYGRLDDLRALLAHGGDARERPWIHHAILRGRSIDHIRLLVAAGADLRAVDRDGISLYRWAQQFGRGDVLALLQAAGIHDEMDDAARFVAACARGDESAARALLLSVPDVFARLTPKQLQALPELADTGNLAAVRTMLALGWPREVTAAWGATALNLAVYRGDAAMAALLLDAGADWRTPHGFGGNVLGTLGYASENDLEDPDAPRDYVGCARALLAGGVPVSAFDGLIFAPDVAAIIDAARLEQAVPLDKPYAPP